MDPKSPHLKFLLNDFMNLCFIGTLHDDEGHAFLGSEKEDLGIPYSCEKALLDLKEGTRPMNTNVYWYCKS